MTKKQKMQGPAIFPREKHGVSRKHISKNAQEVLRRLQEAGFTAYLVGGGVRDLLVGGRPKDFDVATSATPEQVRELFSNCILIGKRFRLAHIRFGNEIIEVATYRAPPRGEESPHLHTLSDEGMILRDNVYGTLEEDAWRRDFTVNALYYDLEQLSILDYTGGMEDLTSKTLRIIGNPVERFREDPVRMLRAIRFMNKLNFSLQAELETLIPQMAVSLGDIPAARLFEEFIKLFMHGQGRDAFRLLEKYGLFYELFPYLMPFLNAHPEQAFYRTFFENAFTNTDKRIAEGRPVTPAFLFAVLIWPLYQSYLQGETAKKRINLEEQEIALERALAQHRRHMALPRRFSLMIREIWELQIRLENPKKKQVATLISSTRFRAGYDFLLLRFESGDLSAERATWWTLLQESDEATREQMINQLSPARRRRKRKPKKKSIKDDHPSTPDTLGDQHG